jgi:hypothetical protein
MKSTSETFGGIEIKGSKDFIAEMKEALMLLQFSPGFLEALPFLKKIDSVDILGAKAAEHRYDGNKPAYNHTSISYGGDIAVLAYRSMLQSKKHKAADVEERCAEFRTKVEQELYNFSLNDYRQSFMTWTWR